MGDIVNVWVLSVDVAKKRIALTMKPPRAANRKTHKAPVPPPVTPGPGAEQKER